MKAAFLVWFGAQDIDRLIRRVGGEQADTALGAVSGGRDQGPVSSDSAQHCRFATLHDLIPEVVGDCVDDEYHDSRTGDALQRTTNGLLVWRKSDNWTAFTDGSQSWVNGPLGLQQRQNDQRLWWEANPDGLAIIPTPEPGERCHTAGLALSLGRVDVGAGNLVGTCSEITARRR